MEGKTHSFKGKVYSEVPDEIVKALGIKPGDTIEFKKAGQGFQVSCASAKASQGSVLEKLNGLKHIDRTEKAVKELLDSEELKILEDLVKKKVAFKYSKEGRKMIGIDKKYYRPEDPFMSDIQKAGCMITEDIREASGIAEDPSVRGVRGFDKRYYFVTEKKLGEAKTSILKALKQAKSAEQAAKEAGISEDLCRACIEVLKEDGEIIEKQKGVYLAA